MPNETVTVTISGANGPQTRAVTVFVDPATGSGSTTVSYTGGNGGSDTLSAAATITGRPLTSNTAAVNWQTTNNAIQLAGLVDCYAWGDSPHSSNVACYIWSAGQRPLSSAGVHAQNNSLRFDVEWPQTSLTPPTWTVSNANGTAVTFTQPIPYTDNFNCIVLANLLVPRAGGYTLGLSIKDNSMWGLGASTTGAVPTWPGKGGYACCYGQTATINNNFPLLQFTPCSGSGFSVASGSSFVNFPAAGLYPLEINWDYWYHSGLTLHVTANGGEMAPVTYIGPPAGGGSPTGNLTLTPTGGATNLAFVGAPMTLTVTVSGISYTSVPYIGAYEGVSGSLPLYNSASSNVFTYPTYNSQAVDKIAASSAAWGLSGDNSSWNGRMSVNFDGTNFVLKYNGNRPDNHVDATTLTISADDIAWYYSGNKSLDTFGISSSGGGVQTVILIDWLANPTISSVSPTNVSAGTTANIAVSLSQPFSPRQMGTQYSTGNTFAAAFSLSGATVTATTPVYDGGGWLTGWNLTCSFPASTSNYSCTLNTFIHGTLTYLNGTGFTTGPVTYINGGNFNGGIATINVTGGAYIAPVAYAFSVAPTTTVYIDTSSSSVTLTGIVFQYLNTPITLTFTGIRQSTAASFTIGAGSQTGRTTGSFGGQSGWLTTFQTTFIAQSFWPYTPGCTMGFTATDTTSGLQCSYQSSTLYLLTTGGGGGGGCFTAAVGIATPTGETEIGTLPTDSLFEIVNQTGTHMAELLVHENYKGWMIKLASGKLVTLDHLMKLTPHGTTWLSAGQKYDAYERVWFEGTVYNIHVITNDSANQHFILFNGDVAHNNKIPGV